MGSLRTRLAVLVAAVSLVLLAAAGAVIVSVADRRMHDAVRDEALRAIDRARQSAEAGVNLEARPGNPIVTIVGQPTANEHLGDPLEVIASELVDLAAGEIVTVRRDVNGAPAYVAATRLDTPAGPVTVVTVAPLTETERTLSALRTSTAVAVPVMSALLGVLAAIVAGRVLRPVAVMRAEADAISHGTLHRRLSPAARSAELAELADTMNAMLDRLERAATSQRQLLSDVSHELRSPLATIRGTLEVASGQPGTLADAGPPAIAEIDRIDGLVADLLTLSRLDEPAALRTEEIDLDDLVAEHVAAVRRPGLSIDASNVRHVRIRADRRAINATVRNVLGNAARHASTTVIVWLATDAHQIVFTVDDDGGGIPPDHRLRVFERFTRLDEGRARDAGGAGLGLAVAAAAVHAHGGTIEAGAAPIGGARLVVRIPAAAT